MKVAPLLVFETSMRRRCALTSTVWMRGRDERHVGALADGHFHFVGLDHGVALHQVDLVAADRHRGRLVAAAFRGDLALQVGIEGCGSRSRARGGIDAPEDDAAGVRLRHCRRYHRDGQRRGGERKRQRLH